MPLASAYRVLHPLGLAVLAPYIVGAVGDADIDLPLPVGGAGNFSVLIAADRGYMHLNRICSQTPFLALLQPLFLGNNHGRRLGGASYAWDSFKLSKRGFISRHESRMTHPCDKSQ